MASAHMLNAVRTALAAHAPFAQMAPEDLEALVAHLSVKYVEPGADIIHPDTGVPDYCYIIKQGVVRGDRSASLGADASVELSVGEMFPVGSLLADRRVMSHYKAVGDVFLFRLPKAAFLELVRTSEPFALFCRRHLRALLDLSQTQVQMAYAQQATFAQSLNMTLGNLVRRAAVTCAADETLETAFRRMDAKHVGSILVTDDEMAQAGEPVIGILTRTDLIAKIILPQVPLHTPVREVMTSPVVSLDARATAADAILAMAQYGVRHLPVVRDARLLGVVSERDLFALQRLSVRQVSDAIRTAHDTSAITQAADDIRALSRNLVAQGVGAAQVTSLISRLNDALTVRLIDLFAVRHGIDVGALCWLALGSEGRDEQTIATDQDNGLILADDADISPQQALAFAQEVNRALDAAGYPLCKGNIMAGNPQWCLPLAQWREVFTRWIDGGDPQALLNASVFFDFRALAGNRALATQLRASVTELAARTPRFLKQLSDNALRNRVPQSLAERLGGQLIGQLLSDDVEPIDLKLHGTMPFVDAARIHALACGVDATNTPARLRAVAERGRLRPDEVSAWIDAFQFMQLMRLRMQHAGSPVENPNQLVPEMLSDLDRRILKEALRLARKVQQRLEVDFPG